MSTFLANQARHIEGLFEPKEQDRKAGIERLRSNSNAGLVWHRYMNLWTTASGGIPQLTDGADRRRVLERFVLDFNARQKPPATLGVRLLEALHARQGKLVKDLMKGAEHRTAQVGRFASGLGSPHPTEIGFTFDRNIGVPFLQGSSVKGLARAAADLFGHANRDALFGPDAERNRMDPEVGDLVFLDAYPAAWPKLELDIINCHHSDYYGSDGRRPPSETESPIPVYFITVAAGTSWTFRVWSRTRSSSNVGAALELLSTGLKELGAGAKTAVGYGLFSA